MIEKTWDARLPGCFAGMAPPFGAPFGQHPHDMRRAMDWAESLRERRLDWPNAQAQIEAYLRSENVPNDRIQKEVARARALIGARL